MKRLSLLALVSAAFLAPRAEATLIIGGSGTLNVGGQLTTDADPNVPTFPGTLVTNGGVITGMTTGDLYFGTNILPSGQTLFTPPPTTTPDRDAAYEGLHPDYAENLGDLPDFGNLLVDVDDLSDDKGGSRYLIDDKGNIVRDPDDNGLPYIPPPPTFIVIDQSDDGSVSLGYDQVTGNWQLRRALTGEINPLPMVSATDLLEGDAVGPTVMLTLLPNGLSGDGTTVIGTHPSGSSFRYRGDERGRLELLDTGATLGYGSPWAVNLNLNGDIVVGQVARVETGRWQAARWNAEGGLTVLNPLDSPHDHVAKLVTPDGSVVAGDVRAVSEERGGVVPFIWSEAKGFRQLGDPTASDEQVIVMTLSDDGQTLGGVRGTPEGDATQWFWTEDGGFQDLILVVCEGPFGDPVENYTLTGVDLEREIFMGNFEDGRQFLTFDGVTILPTEWMATIPEPVETLSSAMGIGAQAMEGAHHRPISQLAIPGKESFAWVTGDIGKATKERDAEQVSGEAGYGFRLSPTAVLGVAFGYSDLDQDFANGAGSSRGTFMVADLGFALAGGETTLTALVGDSRVTTQRSGSNGDTSATTVSLRARHDLAAVGKLGGVDIRPFASLTYDHAKMDAYAETGGVAPAAFDARSQDSWIGRLGASGKVSLAPSTDLTVTLEVAHVLGENRPDFTGTDVITGLLDFAMPDQRGRETWGRLGLDLDHQIAQDTVLSVTFHGSTRGDTFDVAGALSVRKGF